MSRLITIFSVFIIVLTSAAANAQVVAVKKPDSSRAKTAADSSGLRLGASGSLSGYAQKLSSQKAALHGSLSKLKNIGEPVKSIKNRITQPLAFNLSLEDAVRYQPLPNTLIINPSQKFANVFSIVGNVQAWGIPLNFNFSNDHNNLNALGGIRNSLFKFDFNPAQFSNSFKSDLQQYYDIRKNALAGLDLTGFTQQALKNKLSSGAVTSANKVAGSSIISKYVSKPENVTALLSLSEEQIRQKLQAVVKDESGEGLAAANSLKNASIGNMKSVLPDSAHKAAVNQLQLQTGTLNDIAGNPQLNQYLSKAENLKDLKLMNEQQINRKLSSLSALDSAAAIKIIGPDPGLAISAYVNQIIADQRTAKLGMINDLSRQIFLSRTSGQTNPAGLIRQKQHQLDQDLTTQAALLKAGDANFPHTALNSEDQLKTHKEIDSVASTITSIKNQLEQKGVDINKLLQTQQTMEGANGRVPDTETGNALLSRKPQSAVQSLFSRVQAFKIGSFGNKAPGATQNDDLFMQGTHLTYKAGNMPVTLGYGNLNDINSSKDANYQASDYNLPKTITYAGVSVNRGVFGNAKISIIGSSGNGTSNYNSYTVPTAPSNNVALTVAKSFNTDQLGKFSFDVSKSSTIYYNNYVQGSEGVIERKSGLSFGEGNLIQAVSFGFNHQLDVKSANLNENFYFNYAGSGYQNPGNNGFGGGGTKLGGNVKKAFYKNKLIFNVSTSLNTRSISYTSNDQWKTYQVQLDSRYNLSKKINISLKYSNGGTDKQIDNLSTPVYSSQKYQLDGNASYKIGKNYTVSHITLGKQDYNNSYLSASGSSLFMVNYTQSLILGRNSLTGTMFYNKELSSYTLIGNLLNSDLTYQYMLFRKISMSSAVTYLSNTGIASQTGIRQSIQLLAGSHFDLDTFIDLRKNLVTPLYPDLYAACRAELSLKYHLKN